MTILTTLTFVILCIPFLAFVSLIMIYVLPLQARRLHYSTAVNTISSNLRLEVK
jgi:hypothetical protein